MPELYHPDEPAYVLQALAVGRGLPNGLTFANPPLYKYLLVGEYAAAYGADRLFGHARSAQEFVDQFRADPSRLYLIARVTSAVFGALTALAAAWLATFVGGRRAGWIAGGLTGVTYLAVRESHFGVNDALLALLGTLGLVFSVRITQHGARRDSLVAGALTGLAFAAKYDGIALLVPLCASLSLAPKSQFSEVQMGPKGLIQIPHARRAYSLMALAAGALAALVAFPSVVTEPQRVLHDIYVHLYVAAREGYDGLDPSGGYAFYAKALATGLGWPLLLASVLGLGLSLAKHQRSGIVIASLPLALLIALGSQQLYFARFALPAVPALIVGAALALDALMTRQLAIGLVATALVALPTVADAVRFDALLTRPDTRTLSSQWLATSLPAQATIAVDAPPLGPSLYGEQQQQLLMLNDWSVFDLTPVEYHARGVDYLVVSSFTAEARAIDPTREARRIAFNRSVSSQATLVAQFRPYAGDVEPPFEYDQIYAPFNALDELDRPGPTITVYRVTR